MGKKEVAVVLFVLAFVLIVDRFVYTGQPVRDSKYYFISDREREDGRYEPRYNLLRMRAQSVIDQPRERFPLLFNYTLVELYVTELFEPKGKHPRPFFYQIVRRPDRKGISIGDICKRRDGRRGRWTVNINNLWICD